AVQLAPSETASDIEAEIEREERALFGGGSGDGEFQYNVTESGDLVPEAGGAPARGGVLPPAQAARTQAPLDLSHLNKQPRNMQLSRGAVPNTMPGIMPAEAAGSPFAGGAMAGAAPGGSAGSGQQY